MPYSIGEGFAQAGQTIGEAMQDYHKEHNAYDKAYKTAEALSRFGIDAQGNLTSVMDAQGKKKPDVTQVIDPKALEIYQAKTAEGRQKAMGGLEAISRIGLGIAAKAAGSRIEDTSLSGQATKQRMQQSAQEFPVELEGKKATTEHVQEETATSKEKRKAEAEEPSVAMDIGGGNIARVKVGELIKHPEFLKDQSAKDLNNQVFAATGLGIPQIAQGWNKRIVNGQLSFEAPVTQQTIDPITQKPISKYNADGTPAYEMVQGPVTKDNPSGKVTKTMQYKVPEEMTPDVLRIVGTEGVSGAEQVKIPAEPKRGGKPGIVPGSVQSGAAVRITTDDDYRKLPPGTTFIGPDGVPRKKPGE